MTRLGKSATVFIAIGLLIYAGLYFGAERLMYRNGHSNPLFKIATADAKAFDWVILGASHAMPLAFADFNDVMQAETGLRIINLASPGTGPLYNRFVLQAFLRDHTTKNLLYVADSFAFHSQPGTRIALATPNCSGPHRSTRQRHGCCCNTFATTASIPRARRLRHRIFQDQQPGSL